MRGAMTLTMPFRDCGRGEQADFLIRIGKRVGG